MAKFYRDERIPFVISFLERYPVCQARWDDRCQGQADQVHERLPQGRGGNAVPIDGDESNFMAVCGVCHRLITDNDGQAKERGFLL